MGIKIITLQFRKSGSITTPTISVVSNTINVSGTVGSNINQYLEDNIVYTGTQQIQYSYSSLPAGLSITHGTLEGTPSSTYSGNVVITVTASDTGGASASFTLVFNITSAASLVRNSTTITTISGTENEAISGNNLNMSNYITATACTPTYSASGLPTGLTINSSTGVISGTPTSSTTGNITITVSATGLQSVTFTVPYSIEAASSGGDSGYTIRGLTGDLSIYNKTYTDSGTTNNDQPVYTNGNYALWLYRYQPGPVAPVQYAWVISPASSITSAVGVNDIMYSGFPICGTMQSLTTPDNVSYWYSNYSQNYDIIIESYSGGGGSSSSGGLPTEPIGTEKLVVTSLGPGGDNYSGDYLIVQGSSNSTNSIWYNSSKGMYIIYASGAWHIDNDGNSPFSININVSDLDTPNVWNGVGDGLNVSITYSSSGESSSDSSSSGGSFVWGTTQSFTISGSSTSTINTTYTWNSNTSRYESTGGYYVTYEDWDANNQVSVRISDMTEYYIMGTGGDIAGTKTWTNIMTGVEETLTITAGGSSGGGG